MENYFTKEDTKIIKGIAIILMLIHHLWGFPDRIIGGELKHILNIDGKSIISLIGAYGKICVSIFFFLGGYGIYMNAKKKNFDLLEKIKGLYIILESLFCFCSYCFHFFSKSAIIL